MSTWKINFPETSCCIFIIFILFNSYSRFQGIYSTPKIKKVRADWNFVWFFRFCIRSDNLGAFWVHFDGFANMTKIRVFSFETFLELGWHLQSTRSRRLVNGFWCLLMQNEAESLFVFFPLFPTHFCWVENNEHFQWNKKLRFVLVLEFNVVVGMGLKMTKILHLHNFCWLKTKV